MRKRNGPIDLTHIDGHLKSAPVAQPVEQVQSQKEVASRPQVARSAAISLRSRAKKVASKVKKHIRYISDTAIRHTKWLVSGAILRIKTLRENARENPSLRIFSGLNLYVGKTRELQERIFAMLLLGIVVTTAGLGSVFKSFAVAEDVKDYASYATNSFDTTIKTSIADGQYLKAQVHLKQLVDEMASFQNLLPKASVSIFAEDSWVLALHKLIDSSTSLAHASDSLLVVYGNITQLLQDMEELSQDEYKARYKSLTEYIAYQWQLLKETVLPALDKTYSVLSEVPMDLVPQEYREKISTMKKTLEEMRVLANAVDDVLPSILLMLGEREPKTYAILLQNSAEMRATGGFIGSVVLVKVNDGWIEKMEFKDVYDFDGQVFESIPAPAGIAQISENFRLRDANYWPDFPTSARQIAWFLDKHRGPGVDGVIAINDTVIRDLLAMIGPVPLEFTDASLTAETFLPTLSYIVENKLAGHQPKEVLFAFAETFLHEMRAQILKKPEILKSLLLNMEQKNIVAFSFDQEVQELFRKVGVSGELFSYGQSQKNTIDDYFMLVHTAIGGNKSDYFMRESASHVSTIHADGTVQNSIALQRSYLLNEDQRKVLKNIFDAITPLNEEMERLLLSGDNVHYLRWYLPKDSYDISIDGIESKDLLISEEAGKRVVGFTQTVKAGEVKESVLRYSLRTTADKRSPLSYRLMVEKEPGGKSLPVAKTVKANGGTVVADYVNSVTENKLQPLVLEDEQKQILLTGRSLVSYLLYFQR